MTVLDESWFMILVFSIILAIYLPRWIRSSSGGGGGDGGSGISTTGGQILDDRWKARATSCIRNASEEEAGSDKILNDTNHNKLDDGNVSDNSNKKIEDDGALKQHEEAADIIIKSVCEDGLVVSCDTKEETCINSAAEGKESSSTDNTQHLVANEHISSPSSNRQEVICEGADGNAAKETQKEESTTPEEPTIKRTKDGTTQPPITTNTVVNPQSQTPPPAAEAKQPKLETSSVHPGLQAFQSWQGSIASIYRIYSIGNTNEDIFIPLQPKSERGYVKLHLEVTNRTSRSMDVFWMDHLGKEVYKGSASPGETWNQTTWIGHPWLFRRAGDGKVLVHFIPYRIVPTTDRVPTMFNDGKTRVGTQRFSIHDAGYDEGEMEQRKNEDTCQIMDSVLHHPPSRIDTVQKALEWSCRQLERDQRYASPRTLLKYLYNIMLHPSESKYRQIRVANKVFWNEVWITAGRGILHALGFVEVRECIEMGASEEILPSERIRQVADAIQMLEQIMQEQEGNTSSLGQPRGVDGTGRGGFGTAGQMNDF